MATTHIFYGGPSENEGGAPCPVVRCADRPTQHSRRVMEPPGGAAAGVRGVFEEVDTSVVLADVKPSRGRWWPVGGVGAVQPAEALPRALSPARVAPPPVAAPAAAPAREEEEEEAAFSEWHGARRAQCASGRAMGA
jgi:hypothetical protein